MVKLIFSLTVCAAAAQYLYDRSKPHPVYSFGSPHGDVSNKIEEEEEEEEAEEESDDECCGVSDGQAQLHNSSSQTSLIRQRLSADDNGNVIYSAIHHANITVLMTMVMLSTVLYTVLI